MTRRIGIVGGGQLGKMLAIAAKKLGFTVTVIDPTPESPAGQVADKQIIADYKDENAIRKLAKLSNVITFEIELANDEVLFKLMKNGTIIHPSPQTLGIIRDKLKQKQFLRLRKLPTAAFMEVPNSGHPGGRSPIGSHKDSIATLQNDESVEKIKKATQLFGYPLLLKARTDAYDGRGNFLIRNKSDIEKRLQKLQGRTLYVEQFVPFVKELAVMVARSSRGEIQAYPVVETIHKDNICDTVLVPAPISQKAMQNAQQLAIKTMQYLKGAGAFGIELFLLKDDTVLINEIAPRVHNSGHYSIEATLTSQFEQHIRAITGLPLGATAMVPRAVVMKNILATANGQGYPLGIEKALKIPGVSLHIYGKHESRPQRKMGHITVIGDTVEECLRKANKARRALVI